MGINFLDVSIEEMSMEVIFAIFVNQNLGKSPFFNAINKFLHIFFRETHEKASTHLFTIVYVGDIGILTVDISYCI